MLYFGLEKKYDNLVRKYVEQHTPYRYKDILGIGGYGVAYLIEHKLTQQLFVLKRLKAKRIKKASSRQKFQLEITILESLKSPFFPRFLENGEIEGIPFYIMEYVEGQTFEQVIFQESKQFSLQEALQIIKQLLEIVVYMHNLGIVHRDLRIPNILVRDNALKIIDFGLATYVNNRTPIGKIKNPKKAENYISDLYFIGHFLLFLLYSNYTPTNKRERQWQEELQLPVEVIHYIERLLLIRTPFTDANDALMSIPKVK